MVLLTENERSQEVDMTMDEVLRAVKWLIKERERIRLKSIRSRRAKGIQARNFRPKADPDAPAPEKRARGRPKAPVDPDAPKRSRGRPRKNQVPDIQVIIPPVPQEEPVVQEIPQVDPPADQAVLAIVPFANPLEEPVHMVGNPLMEFPPVDLPV